MSTPEGNYCEPYPVSNDVWSAPLVREVREALAAQEIPREQATAFVVGVSGLPYIAPDLKASRLTLLDRSAEVITVAREHLGHIASADTTTWGMYKELATSSQYLNEGERIKLGLEIDQALESGFARDFSVTQASARSMEITHKQGDITATLPLIGEQLRQEGRVASFLHFTNVGQYLDVGPVSSLAETAYKARQQLVRIVDHLPTLSSTVILDSSFNHMRPRIYTPDTYRTNPI